MAASALIACTQTIASAVSSCGTHHRQWVRLPGSLVTCAEEKGDIEKLDAKRRMLEARITKSSATGATRAQRASRDQRRSVLRCAEVVVATLSAAGGDLPSLLAASGRGAAMDAALRFDAVIIDEAAQAVEPATLIPMRLLDPVKVLSPGVDRQASRQQSRSSNP